MTFLCNASFEYGWAKKIGALDFQDYTALRGQLKNVDLLKVFPQHGFDVTKAEKEHGHLTYHDLFLDGDEVEALSNAGLEMKMKRVKGVASDNADIRKTVYQISVANIGLMQIQRVEVLEDCCTYDLQSYLDKGWRLIAVCPPNDARRPSYIVGHFEKDAR